MIDLRKGLLVLVLGVIAIFFQGTVLREVMPAGIVPNLLLLIVVFLGFFEATIGGATLAFLLGVELDFASGLLVGPWAGAFVVSFGLLASLSQRLFVESVTAAMVAALACSLVANFVYFVLVFEFHPSVTEVASFSLVEAFINAVLAPPALALLRGLLGPRSRGSAGRLRSARV